VLMIYKSRATKPKKIGALMKECIGVVRPRISLVLSSAGVLPAAMSDAVAFRLNIILLLLLLFGDRSNGRPNGAFDAEN
jgi:hypothetical protein